MVTFEWWHAVILGVIEGLTEFLPVSSTFHLLWSSRLLGLDGQFLHMFDVAIQTGGILAVLHLFGRELASSRKLLGLVVAAFVPTALIGYLFHLTIQQYVFDSAPLQLAGFLAVGVFFLLYEWRAALHEKERIEKSRKNTSIKHKPSRRLLADLTWADGVTIGLFQSLAVIPGVSRAGAVIIGMLLLNIRRDEAAKFSFLLALPTIVAASGLSVMKYQQVNGLSEAQLGFLVIGATVSFMTALVVLRWFIRYLQHHSLALFGWYRIVVGCALLGWLLAR